MDAVPSHTTMMMTTSKDSTKRKRRTDLFLASRATEYRSHARENSKCMIPRAPACKTYSRNVTVTTTDFLMSKRSERVTTPLLEFDCYANPILFRYIFDVLKK